ncbi:enoyl-CoA hydratase-related protein [Dietzia sp.]|uniref:enoyl-CoA hydratase-related protein n=1 Tax=Dietzia sp. TaxID=1871616 RepID=UPI002FD9C5BE
MAHGERPQGDAQVDPHGEPHTDPPGERRLADAVRYRTEGFAAHVTLDTPHNRNALSSALLRGLGEALDAAEADPAVRLVLLGHTGGTFCAGADLTEASGADGADGGDPAAAVAARTRAFLGLVRRIVTAEVPVAAVVDGHARAGGVGLVAACDFAIAGPHATFGISEVRLGLAPAMISLALRHRMGPRALARAALTGRTFGGAEAVASGLITEFVDAAGPAASAGAAGPSAAADPPDGRPSDAREELVGALVQSLGKSSPAGLAATKALLAAPLLADLDAEGERVAEISAEMFLGEDAAEGVTAFLERRSPAWVSEAKPAP